MDLSKRPECPKLQVGDEVFVRRSQTDMRGRPESQRYVPAVVAKAGRVWVTLRSSERVGRAWRMRLDTQTEATPYSGSNASFVTPEQREWDERMATVSRVISDADVELERRSSGSWTPARRAALADFIVSLGVLDDLGDER